MSLTCFFCGEEIAPEDILFVDTAWPSTYPDDVHYKHLVKFLDYPLSNVFSGLYHMVDDKAVVEKKGEIPVSLIVNRKDGLTPRELEAAIAKRASEGKNAADGEGDEAGKPIKITLSQGSSFASAYDTGYANDNAKPNDQPGYELTQCACPHCHCALPQGFGELPVFTIAMLGGRAAGKTTFLINALQQLNAQLTGNQLGTVTMLHESKVYYDSLIKLYVDNKGVLPPTPMGVDRRVLCPLVFHFQGLGANRNKACFVVIHDLAGEGCTAENRHYIVNHQGIREAKNLMMIIDPHQIQRGMFVREHGNNDVYEVDMQEFLLRVIRANAKQFKNIERVVVVMTKIDVPLTQQQELFGMRSTLMQDIGGAHRGRVSYATIRQAEEELAVYLRHQLPYDIKKEITDSFGRPEAPPNVRLTAVSTRTARSDGTHVTFANQYEGGAPKHRIIEPLLLFLSAWGMIEAGPYTGAPAQDAARQPADPPKENAPKKRPRGWRKKAQAKQGDQ